MLRTRREGERRMRRTRELLEVRKDENDVEEEKEREIEESGEDMEEEDDEEAEELGSSSRKRRP